MSEQRKLPREHDYMYMELCNIWIFAILPILTTAIIFAVKRKLLWIAPIVSTILAFITYAIVFAPIKAMFANNEWRTFLFLALFKHLGMAVFLTVIVYLAARIIERNKKK